MNKLDPILLQRLVDGELELDQLRHLLTDADSNPERWKEIATAMVEDRVWQSSVRDSHLGGDISTDSSTKSLEVPSVAVPINRPTPGTSPGDWSRFNTLFWVAASIFLASVLGYLLGGFVNSTNYVAQAPVNSAAHQPAVADPLDGLDTKLAQVTPEIDRSPALRTTTPNITPAVYQPDYHLELPDSSRWMNVADAGPLDPVPLYEIGNRDQLRQFQQQTSQSISPELVQQFIDAGYDMQQEIEFISGSMEQDQRFIVPVRTIRFVPRQ